MVVYVFLGLWSAFTAFVIFWVILSSFKTNSEIFRNVFSFPKKFQFINYATALSAEKFGLFFLNSIIVTSASVIILLAISAPASYVLSRVRFPGRRFLTSLYVAGIGIPYSITLIPLFVIMTKLALINTLHGLVLIYVSLSIPFTVYILTGFFSSLPSELEEAGIIDGCNDFQVFGHIMLPLASPGLITAAIFNGIGLWNEYQLVLVFVSNQAKRTIALGLYSMQNSMEYTGNWVGLFAGVTIIMLPTIVLFVILSGRMISGLTMGGVKS